MGWKGDPVSDVSGMSQQVLPPRRLSGSAQPLLHTIQNLLESAGLGAAMHQQYLVSRAAVCCDPLQDGNCCSAEGTAGRSPHRRQWLQAAGAEAERTPAGGSTRVPAIVNSHTRAILPFI